MTLIEHEVLLDDARRMLDGMRAAGSDARLHVGRGMQHDWPLTMPWLAESACAWRVVDRFVDEICERQGAPTERVR